MKLKPAKLPTIRRGRHEFSSFSRCCITIVRPGSWTPVFRRRILYSLRREGWLVSTATFYFRRRHPRWMEMNQAPRRRSYEKPPRAHTGLLLFYGRQCVQPYIWYVLAGLKATIKRWLFISNCFEFPRAFMTPRP